MCPVVLRDFPVRVMQAAREHSEALLREFAMIVHGAGDHDAHVPQRLLELARLSEQRYADLNPHAEAVVEEALARGEDLVDLHLEVPVTFRQETLDAAPILLEVEDYCRRGELLTLVPSDEIRTFWVWYLGEFVRQVEGQPPIAWREYNKGA
jgi:hypothetical protein